MSDHLHICESFDPKPLRVDHDKCIVYGAKIVGPTSKNRREYQGKALQAAISRYEGAIVNADHADVFKQSNPPQGLRLTDQQLQRGLTDRFAQLRKIEYKEGDGLYAGEVHCDPNHPYTRSFLWWAENAPDKLALSQVVRGTKFYDSKRGVYVHTSIDEVISVDVVCKGGTNETLFESYNEMNENEDLGIYVRQLFGDGTAIGDVKTRITQALALSASQPREFKGTVAEALAALADSADARVRLVTADLDQRIVAEAKATRLTKVRQACKDAKLPDEAITEVYVESLSREAEENWKASIEDRRKVCSVAGGDRTKSLGADTGKIDFEQFCAAVKSGKR